MNIRKRPGARFGQEVRFEKAEIDQMCEEALQRAALLPSSPGPIRIERFIEKHFSCRLLYEEIGDGVLGCTGFNKDGSIALVAVSPSLDDGSDTGRRRVRSTVAHEGGHCLMHPILFMDAEDQLDLGSGESSGLDFKGRRILCRSGDIDAGCRKAYDGRWWEYQANRAIGGFLLPKRLVSMAVAPFTRTVGALGCCGLDPSARREAEKHIAVTFDVNPIVARIRLAEMFPDTGGQGVL